MITKLDIEKFGLFDNYKWDVEIGKQKTFLRVNIIYGGNCSGKRTSSEISKCLEDQKNHKDYPAAKFNIKFSNDKSVSQNNIYEELIDYNLRVCNSDFVKQHLSWLYNENGTINPFTILGAKNVETDGGGMNCVIHDNKMLVIRYIKRKIPYMTPPENFILTVNNSIFASSFIAS